MTKLHSIIEDRVLIKNLSSDPLISSGNGWIFDFRSVLLDPECLDLITSLLWERIQHFGAFQIGGLETASIPLIASIVLRAQREGRRVNGFYIRKGRKKYGLYKTIEGKLNTDPIILIDDLINTGSSIAKQLEILAEVSAQVIGVVTIVRFYDTAYYESLFQKNIPLFSLFSLAEFDVMLPSERRPQTNTYKKTLLYRPRVAAYGYVLTKSTPAVSEEALYYGTDEGKFIALDKTTGHILWEYKVGYGVEGKHIFSSPSIFNDMVFFGSYDGKVHALDRFYGEIRWVFADADAVGSSPVIAPDLNLVFIGLEFALPGRRGATVALDLTTGEKVWEYDSAAYTHATPLYIKTHTMVCNGGNEGVLRAFNAKTGELLWQFETEGGSSYDGRSGFSGGDIKLAPVYDAESDQIAVCSLDGWMYVLDRKTGHLKFRAHSDFHDTNHRAGIFGSPLFTDEGVIFGALDKHIYCYNKATGALIWKYMTGGRIFSTPVRIENSVFIGSNDGCLYEFSIEKGTLISQTFFGERITNPIRHDAHYEHIYVTTQANELYVLTK